MLFYLSFAAFFVATCNGMAQPLYSQPQYSQPEYSQPEYSQPKYSEPEYSHPEISQPSRSSICVGRNGYYKDDEICDSYVECKDYQAMQMICPDGLHYNPETEWPEYPCGYPMDVPCLARGGAQPSQPTAECPHQYGFYPSSETTSENCGKYKMCVAGQATEMSCPTGLAFDPDTSRCDWPELVDSCSSDDFLGFRCPAIPTDQNGKPLDIVLNYKYEGECLYFFSCERGRARLLSCDTGLAFDSASGRCIDADRVNCNDS